MSSDEIARASESDSDSSETSSDTNKVTALNENDKIGSGGPDETTEAVEIKTLADELEGRKSGQKPLSIHYAYDVATLMTNRGFSLVRLGELRAELNNARLRALVLTECVAIVAHAELMQMLRESVGNNGPRRCVAEFFNLLLGFHDQSGSFWRDKMVPKMTHNFDKLLNDDESAHLDLVPAHILVFQLLRSLLTHRTGLVLAAVAQERISRFTPYGHDRRTDRPDPALRASAAAMRSSRCTTVQAPKPATIDDPSDDDDDDGEDDGDGDASATEKDDDHAPLGWQVDDEDVEKQSAERLQTIAVHSNDPQSSEVNWTELILLISDESDEARLKDLIEHGKSVLVPTVLVSAADTAAETKAPTTSTEPSNLDDEWVLLHEKETPTATTTTSEAAQPRRKSSKTMSLRAGLAHLKLGLLQVTNSLKK